MRKLVDRNRIPHTRTQVALGLIGLILGGLVAIIFGLLIYLLSAPRAMNIALGSVMIAAIILAVGVPTWYWIGTHLVGQTD